MDSVQKKNKTAYENLYTNGDAAASYEVRVKVETIKRILPSLKHSSKVLEIGYGTGDLLHNIAVNNPKMSVVGLELVEEAKRLYKKRYRSDKNITLITGNAERDLGLRENEYQMILASHILEHIKNEKLFLMQIHKILEKGGFFVLAVPEWGDFENHLHYRQYNKKRLLEIEKKYNWKLIQIKGDGFYANKLFYKLISVLPISQKNDDKEALQMESSKSTMKSSLIKSIYYLVIVTMLLKLNSVDTLLFSKLDKKPMQWIAVYKKINEKV